MMLPLRSKSFLPVDQREKGGRLSGRVAPSKVDPEQWSNPPHVYLANLEFNSTAEALLFTRRYGLLINDEDRTDKTEWLYMKNGNFRCDLVEFISALQLSQLKLRAAWYGSEQQVAALRSHPFFETFSSDTPGNLPIEIHSQGNKIEAVTPDLWSFICILFTRDHAEGRLKICPNSACPAPYFVANRHGQIYCRHECAVLVNIHSFRRRLREKKKAQLRKRRRTQR